MVFIVPLLLSLLGTGAQAAGGEAARKTTVSGAESALRKQQAGTAFAEDILGEARELQQPFIEAGQAALPLSQLAARGELDFRDTPIFQQRQSTGLDALLGSIQGEGLSGFGAERFASGLDVSEEALQPARLDDLLSIALGASGVAGQESGRLANIATAGALAGGNLQSAAGQTAFEQQQNALNQALGDLSGLPSFFEATRQPQQQTFRRPQIGGGR